MKHARAIVQMMCTKAPWAALLLASQCLGGTAQAATVGQVETELGRSQQAATRSQSRIDTLDDATKKALQEYRSALLRVEQLRLYKQQLEQQKETQKQRLKEVDEALGRVESSRAAMVPLLVKMTDALAEFVTMDQPFAVETRNQRVSDLRALLADPEVGLAEQYRAVYAAWQAEARSGGLIKAERVALPGAARSQLVDLLQIGRLGLYALSLDGNAAWSWQAESRRFTALPTNAVPSLKKALRVAQEHAAPSLLNVPGAFDVQSVSGGQP